MNREPVDVAIVGAGVIGAATAYYLSQANPDLKIAIVEQDHVGAGSTSRSFAAYRKQFRSRVHILASVHSQRELERFAEISGTDIGQRKIGYLFLYRDQAELDKAAVAVSRQRELGVHDAEVLTAAQVKAKWPYVDGQLAGATWCPSDGYLDPLAIASGYADAARARGVQLITNSRVVGIDSTGGRATGVRLADGVLTAEKIVLATGAWTKRLAPHVPLAPVKRYVYTSHAIKQRDVSSFPMTILDVGPYMRSEARVSLSWAWDAKPQEPGKSEIKDVPGLPDQPDYEIPPEFGRDHEAWGFEILIRLSEVMSFLLEEEIGIADATCGYYEVTPDHRIVIDKDPHLAGLFIAAGASGHGIMHAPVYGMLAADLVLDRAPRIDGMREAFSLAPLLRGEQRPDPETMII